MKLRFGLGLTAAVVFAVGGCAASGGGGGGGGGAPAAVIPGGAQLLPGESPRGNEFTETAEEALAEADMAMTPEAARPAYSEAAAASEQGIAEDATNPLPWLLAGRAYIGLGDYAMADSALDRAEALRPLYGLETEGMRERAWVGIYQNASPLVNSGDFDEARAMLEQAHSIYDRRPEVMILLGRLYAQVGDADQGLEHLEGARTLIESDRILEMDSANAAAWEESKETIAVAVGNLLTQAERYDEVITHAQSALMQFPNHPELMSHLANAYRATGDEPQARAVYDDLLGQGNLGPSDILRIGLGFYNIPDYQASAQAFSAVADEAPRDRDALEWWSRSLVLQVQAARDEGGEPDPETLAQLTDVAERWLELDPNSQVVRSILARAVNDAGDQERAVELIGEIEALEVSVDGVQMQRFPDGGAVVLGQVNNLKLEAGQSVTVRVTFYSESGTTMSTEEATVDLPGPEAAQTFQIDYDTSDFVSGYSVEVVT